MPDFFVGSFISKVSSKENVAETYCFLMDIYGEPTCPIEIVFELWYERQDRKHLIVTKD